ncbi:response regulator [Leptothrix cholodnii]|uniref:response regulator n=1 Tax=Leptothrix cholodnii TaxID=34029 RepID=UPI0002F0C071|nr:response regulator [Leptothrix cholodnii]
MDSPSADLPLSSTPSGVGRTAGLGRWLSLLALVLLGVFAGVGWVQWQSISLLNATVQYQGDNLVWSFYQLESEYEKVRLAARELDHETTPEAVAALQARYEVFVSRISLVEPERTESLSVLLPAQRDVIARVHAFVERTDQLIGPDATPPMDPGFWRQFADGMAPLSVEIHELALQANRDIADQVALRNEAVRRQNGIAIGLTIFQSLLTLLFAVVVVRQVRALQQRRTHLEALAANLQEARIEAEQASRAKSAFLANMSHELRTPFNGLLGMLSLLQRSPLDARQADYLQTARESGEHLLAILNDVLDISKLESGRLEITPERTSLIRVLGDVRSVMSPQAQAKHLRWSVTVADDVPVWIRADAKRLKQVLFNLVGNALKFTENGEVSVHVDCVPAPATASAAPGAAEAVPAATAWLRFAVTDTGIGMDALTLARLFQRFSQGDETINRRFGGTGLGLEISRTLARRMGGDITVRSEAGRGSVFTVLLPFERIDAPPAEDTAPVVRPVPGGVTPAADGQSADPAGGAPLRVLVTDDHPVNRKFMQALLQQLGHQVHLRENGAEALEALHEHTFDLILMDVHMPVMDGLAATRAIRALDGAAAQVKIVALTADAFSESRQRVIDAGMDDFLAKPVQMQDVEEMLRRNFGARAVFEPAVPPADWAPPPEPAVVVAPSQPAVATLAPEVSAPPAPRRRFKRGDASRVLDLEAIGEVCLAVSMVGYGSLLSGFLADESRTIAELIEVLESHDVARFKAAAHKLKGAAANLGLRLLSATAREIEQAEAEPDEARSRDYALRLAEELDLTRALCTRLGLLAG